MRQITLRPGLGCLSTLVLVTSGLVACVSDSYDIFQACKRL